MISEDIFMLIFEQCDLETCVVLSDLVCFQYPLEDVFRRKVQARVPWMTNPECIDMTEGIAPLKKNKSWRVCAKVVVNRSRRALDPANKNLYLIKDMSVPVSLGCNDVMVRPVADFTEMPELREKMEPLFLHDQRILSDFPAIIRGTKLLMNGNELDLKTLKVSRSDYKLYSDDSQLTNQAVSGSGKVVRDSHADTKVTIMGENDHFIHVRKISEHSSADVLVHKKNPGMVKVDQDGTYVLGYDLRSFPAPRVPDPDWIEGNLVFLLPGNAGALAVVEMYEQNHMQALVYVGTGSSSDRTVICTFPPCHTFKNSYSDFSTEFCTFFNGYLYVYFERRLVRLWVDFGYRSKLDEDFYFEGQLMAHSQYRSLTVWDRNFPLIGSLEDPDIDDHPDRGIQLTKGQGNHTLEKYVAVGNGCGSVFGNLLTGQTMVAKTMAGGTLTFPFVIDDIKIAFGSFGETVATLLQGFMTLYDMARSDVSEIYEKICAVAEHKGDHLSVRSNLKTAQDKKKRFKNEKRDLEFEKSGYKPKVVEDDVQVEDTDDSFMLQDGSRITWNDGHYRGVDYDRRQETSFKLYNDIFREMKGVKLTQKTMNNVDNFESLPIVTRQPPKSTLFRFGPNGLEEV